MRKTFLACLVVALVALAPGSVLAYSGTGWDPDDRPESLDPDIRYTTRSVFSLSGVRYLKVELGAYEEISDWWRAYAFLDTQDGPAFDYRMHFGNFDTGGTDCEVWFHNDSASAVDGLFKQAGTVASCRVPLKAVHPDKRIRWYLRSPTMHSGRADRAPDEGWYR